MSDIYVFKPKETDFSGIGEAGSLTPLSVVHTEVKNGMSELEIVHPFDEMGKWTFLQNGYNIIAEVPVRTTPGDHAERGHWSRQSSGGRSRTPLLRLFASCITKNLQQSKRRSRPVEA